MKIVEIRTKKCRLHSLVYDSPSKNCIKQIRRHKRWLPQNANVNLTKTCFVQIWIKKWRLNQPQFVFVYRLIGNDFRWKKNNDNNAHTSTLKSSSFLKLVTDEMLSTIRLYVVCASVFQRSRLNAKGYYIHSQYSLVKCTIYTTMDAIVHSIFSIHQ